MGDRWDLCSKRLLTPGLYKVASQIDIANNTGHGDVNTGRIFGAGKSATVVIGQVDNGFIFTRRNATNGLCEISDMSIYNSSTNLGTGALRILNSTGPAVRNISFTGQGGIDCGWNSFNLLISNCDFGPVVPDVIGTYGIQSNGCTLSACRNRGAHDIFFGAMGVNGHVISNVSCESSNIAFALGMYQGWGQTCTVSGMTLTVGGGNFPVLTPASTQPNFTSGCVLYGTGVPLAAWATIFTT